MMTGALDERVLKEMEAAQTAREEGLEGRARVCARRAAGWALQSRLGEASAAGANALETLREAQDFDWLNSEAKSAVLRLTERVDANYQLSEGTDLLADAWLVIQACSGRTEMAEGIKFYGVTWCGDCRRARRILDENQIPYQWIDIDQDEAGGKYVEQVNRGYRSVPTIVFADGSILVEPSAAELKEKLGI